jgi:hypothetical protein
LTLNIRSPLIPVLGRRGGGTVAYDWLEKLLTVCIHLQHRASQRNERFAVNRLEWLMPEKILSPPRLSSACTAAQLGLGR